MVDERTIVYSSFVEAPELKVAITKGVRRCDVGFAVLVAGIQSRFFESKPVTESVEIVLGRHKETLSRSAALTSTELEQSMQDVCLLLS